MLISASLYQEQPIMYTAQQIGTHQPGMMDLNDHTEPVTDHPVTTYSYTTQQVNTIREQVTGIKDYVGDSLKRLIEVVGHTPELDALLSPTATDPETHLQDLRRCESTLETALEDAHGIRNKLEDEIAEHKKLNMDIENKLQSLRRDNSRLNTIIINQGSPNTGPNDEEVRLRFVNIRDRVQTLVHRCFSPTKLDWQKCKGTLAHEELCRKWLSSWANQSGDVRNYLVQGMTFEIMQKYFFTQPFFGLSQKVEDGLKEFEKILEHDQQSSRLQTLKHLVLLIRIKVSVPDFIEWRRRTVTAAEKLKPIHRAPEKTEKILKALAPTINIEYFSRTKNDVLYHNMLTICKEALELALVFRQSKAILKPFQTESHRRVPYDEDRMEMVAVEPGVSSAKANYVIFTAFGGLEKTTLSSLGNQTIVLEKCRVVGTQ